MKINKIISLVAIFFLGFAVSAFAAGDLSSLHANKLSAHSSSKKTLRAMAIPATDIHVVNQTSEPFTVKVPGTAINDILSPGEVEDIYSDVSFDAIRIQLFDKHGDLFFDDNVENHTILKIKNSPYLMSAQGGKQKANFQVIKENQ